MRRTQRYGVAFLSIASFVFTSAPDVLLFIFRVSHNEAETTRDEEEKVVLF